MMSTKENEYQRESKHKMFEFINVASKTEATKNFIFYMRMLASTSSLKILRFKGSFQPWTKWKYEYSYGYSWWLRRVKYLKNDHTFSHSHMIWPKGPYRRPTGHIWTFIGALLKKNIFNLKYLYYWNLHWKHCGFWLGIC